MIIQTTQNPILELIEVLKSWDLLLSGFLLTLWLYVWALLIGFSLGLILCVLRQYGGLISSRIATLYIEIIRGTPLLAQLYFIYFLPNSLGITIDIPIIRTSFKIGQSPLTLMDYPIFVGILTLGLNSAAYQAEYLRGAIISVGTEQLEAARSLGMSRLTGIQRVILPQALRRVIPAWSNEAAYLPKYTVLVYFIGGVQEIFYQADIIAHRTFFILTTYVIIALIFLITITIISRGLDILHKRTMIPGL
ncbi:MAG: amino acid ABC transporter permease [Candidatus Hermodarchaeota archaeon]